MNKKNDRIEGKIIHFKSINSTNDYAKENFKHLENGTIIIADEQTKGRGRAGRSFLSNNGGLYFSIIHHSKVDISMISIFTQLAAIAVLKALNEFSIDAKVKWPNDIFINGLKACGILTELIETREYHGIIIGIGINVKSNQDEFKKLNIVATSIEDETKIIIDKEILFNKIVSILKEIISDFEKTKDFSKYKSFLIEKSNILGKEIIVQIGNQKYEVKAIDIDDFGNLLVLKDGRIVPLNSSEVHIKI
ncbi:MAG: biotin--[acetyl-CoA-carboxylase] ligase [Tissierellales bacterium]|nr:biotin--[acetyl-CoA-carboxylase] ligase [Tissierellales bacterium]